MEEVRNKLIDLALEYKSKNSEDFWDEIIHELEDARDVLDLMAIARIDFGYETFDEVMNDVKPSGNVIINQTTIINWVSVKDGLPQNRQKVLFGTKNGDVHMAIYLEKLINQYGDYNQLFLADNGGYYQVGMDIVTFWCAVPELPSL